MFVHVVMWKLKGSAEGQTAAENARRMKSTLEALRASVPGIRRLDVGLNVFPGPDAYDVVLYSEFEDRAAYEGYQKHPEHLAAADFIGRIRVERKSVDYEI